MKHLRPGIENHVNEMLKSDETTVGDLVKFYMDAWASVVEARKEFVRRTEAILDDVRSGRASNWQPGAEQGALEN
jgi:hypothetical protein